MRLRKVKNALEILEANKNYYINNPSDNFGNWNKVFNNDNPIHIELGMGKGQFLITLATLNPNINYIGIDLFSSVLVRAGQKLEKLNLNNIKIFCFDALELDTVFNQEVDLLYLNFSDPWPKKAHEKRRLTSDRFLEVYKKILKSNCEIHFKTDNIKLFEYSLENFAKNKLLLKNISLNLHNSNYEGNVMTEYEEKFSKLGPIYRLEAKFRKDE